MTALVASTCRGSSRVEGALLVLRSLQKCYYEIISKPYIKWSLVIVVCLVINILAIEVQFQRLGEEIGPLKITSES